MIGMGGIVRNAEGFVASWTNRWRAIFGGRRPIIGVSEIVRNAENVAGVQAVDSKSFKRNQETHIPAGQGNVVTACKVTETERYFDLYWRGHDPGNRVRFGSDPAVRGY